MDTYSDVHSSEDDGVLDVDWSEAKEGEKGKEGGGGVSSTSSSVLSLLRIERERGLTHLGDRCFKRHVAEERDEGWSGDW